MPAQPLLHGHFILCLMELTIAVAQCVTMTYPYVKKGTLPLPLEFLRMDVCPSFILMVSSLWFKGISSKRL